MMKLERRKAGRRYCVKGTGEMKSEVIDLNYLFITVISLKPLAHIWASISSSVKWDTIMCFLNDSVVVRIKR